MATVVIVGRKNVGKSTIFNRLIGMRQSVVFSEPGVTRDRVYGEVEWCGRTFNIIDTGGFFPQENTHLAKKIHKQITYGIEEADLIYFIVDGMSGLQPGDEEIAHQLRKTDKPIFLVINKMDSKKARFVETDFAALGMKHYYSVSAEAGVGFGDLLDATTTQLPEHTPQLPSAKIRILILGRPNAGKSTLLNALIGSERAIVDHVPGTTRDCLNAQFTYRGKQLEMIDTAGLRRHSRVKKSIEFFSILRTIRWIEHADIVLLLFDTTQGVVDQDIRIASLVVSKVKGLILVPTKIDLVLKNKQHKIIPSTQSSFRSFAFVPIIPVSAHENHGLDRLKDTILAVDRETQRTLGKDIVLTILQHLRPPDNGEIVQLKQIQAHPVVFRALVTTAVKKSYIQYIRKTIRQYSSFPGVPILVRTKKVRKRRYVS